MQGGARGGEARLELDQMPRKALHSKACGERSEDFRAAKQNENLALFRAVRIELLPVKRTMKRYKIFSASSVSCWPLFMRQGKDYASQGV